MDNLPNELLIHIVAPLLDIPDHIFYRKNRPYDGIGVSPFGLSPAQVLFVCWRWNIVLSGEIYKTIVIRSRAQALALARVFTARPELGAFVERARLEGGYGQPIYTLLSHTPNLSQLAFRLESTSRRPTWGLSNHLKSLDLQHVHFLDQNVLYEPQQFVDAIVDAMSCWSNLRSITAPWYILDEERSHIYRHQAFWEPLASLPNLRWIAVLSIVAVATAPSLAGFLKSSSLEEIRLEYISGDEDVWNQMLVAEPRLRYLIRLADKSTEPVALISPLPCPVSSATQGLGKDMDSSIWTKIIELVYRSSELCKISLVCKQFHAIATPLILRHLYIYYDYQTSTDILTKLSDRVLASPLEFAAVQSLTMRHSCVGDSSHFPLLVRLLSHTKGLRTLKFVTSYPWHIFESVANLCGPGLITLIGRYTPLMGLYTPITRFYMVMVPQSPSPWMSFNSLRFLLWDSDGPFTELTIDTKCIEEALPSLETLQLVNCDPSFISLLCLMRLPMLSHLSYHATNTNISPLLTTHGHKLVDLKIDTSPCQWSGQKFSFLDACPNIATLTVYHMYNFYSKNADVPLFSQTKNEHICLTEIILPCTSDKPVFLIRLLQSAVNDWLTMLTALRTIRCNQIIWPSLAEKDIKQSQWVQLSQEIKAASDGRLALVNRQGVEWRERLAVSRS